jgi:hypothetical protein
MDTEEALEAASATYVRAEQAFIAALAAGAEEPALLGLVEQVVAAADEWEKADRSAPPLTQGLTRYYDLPEVLATLWRDLETAYQARLAHHI